HKRMPRCDEEYVSEGRMPCAEEDRPVAVPVKSGTVESKKTMCPDEACDDSAARMSLWQKFVHAITGCDMGGAEESEPKSQERDEPRERGAARPLPGLPLPGRLVGRTVLPPADPGREARGGEQAGPGRQDRQPDAFLPGRARVPRVAPGVPAHRHDGVPPQRP